MSFACCQKPLCSYGGTNGGKHLISLVVVVVDVVVSCRWLSSVCTSHHWWINRFPLPVEVFLLVNGHTRRKSTEQAPKQDLRQSWPLHKVDDFDPNNKVDNRQQVLPTQPNEEVRSSSSRAGADKTMVKWMSSNAATIIRTRCHVAMRPNLDKKETRKNGRIYVRSIKNFFPNLLFKDEQKTLCDGKHRRLRCVHQGGHSTLAHIHKEIKFGKMKLITRNAGLFSFQTESHTSCLTTCSNWLETSSSVRVCVCLHPTLIWPRKIDLLPFLLAVAIYRDPRRKNKKSKMLAPPHSKLQLNVELFSENVQHPTFDISSSSPPSSAFFTLFYFPFICIWSFSSLSSSSSSSSPSSSPSSSLPSSFSALKRLKDKLLKLLHFSSIHHYQIHTHTHTETFSLPPISLHAWLRRPA